MAALHGMTRCCTGVQLRFVCELVNAYVVAASAFFTLVDQARTAAVS
jgi:hypothetical protein